MANEITLEQLDECWKNGKFYYRREHEHELGWSVVNRASTKIIMYGDKNLCCGIALILNSNEYEVAGFNLIKSIRNYI